MRLPKTINLVTQPTLTSCTAACLSMVTGYNIHDVLKEVSDPCGYHSEIRYLTSLGLGCEVSFQIFSTELSIVTCASKNLYDLHSVVLDNRNNKFLLYDPNQGREDKKIIELEDLKWAYLLNIYEF